MKVLTIGSDRKLFEEGSAVSLRAKEYGALIEELYIIVFSLVAEGNKAISLSRNVFVYPTNSKSKWRYFSDARKVAKEITSRKIDLVSTQDPFESGLAGFLIARHFKAKLQLQIHTDFLSPYFKKESFINRLRVIIALFLLPKADGIRVVSERISQSIADRNIKLKQPLIVLPIQVLISKTAANARFLRERYPQFDFIILMATRLEREKNISLALRALLKIRDKHKAVGLIIIGEGSLENSLKKQTDSLDLFKNVIFESWKNDITPYYGGADLFLSTSNYEGFGLSLVEAASLGCPILTTDVGIVGEVLIPEKSAIVVPVGDEQALSAAIFRAYENRPFIKKIAAQARVSVSRLFSQDKAKYLSAYKKTWEKTLE